MNREQEDALEAQLQQTAKAPRVTPAELDANIVDEAYYRFPGTTMTVCCLTLANGFTVVGENSCVSPENFDPILGQAMAFANAREKIWPLLGYELREKLSRSGDAAL